MLVDKIIQLYKKYIYSVHKHDYVYDREFTATYEGYIINHPKIKVIYKCQGCSDVKIVREDK